MAVRSAGLWPACLLAACLGASQAQAQALPSDAFLSRAAADRAQPPLLGAPARALRIATLEWPAPGLTQPGERPHEGGDAAFAFPPPLVMGGLQPPPSPAEEADAPLVFGPSPAMDLAYVELALDLVMSLPGIDEETRSVVEGEEPPAMFGPDFGGMDDMAPQSEAASGPEPAEPTEEDIRRLVSLDMEAATLFTRDLDVAPLYRDRTVVFGPDERRFPALAFEYAALPAKLTLVPLPAAPPREDDEAPGLISPSPAERLALEGPARARAEKCLAEAIYFESRGEPKRGQIAVAQVVVNRVFSGYYPNDVCKTVYQNAHRRNACQFTFACDYVKDVIREPDMWVQAKQIASDMLDGKLWLDSVGRATHYHAYWVRPSWVREMRKLDKIGVHTFYRPRRWDG